MFNTPLLELFPELYASAHEFVLAQTEELYERLQGDPSRMTRVKLDFLEEVLSRGHPHLRDMAV